MLSLTAPRRRRAAAVRANFAASTWGAVSRNTVSNVLCYAYISVLCNERMGCCSLLERACACKSGRFAAAMHMQHGMPSQRWCGEGLDARVFLQHELQSRLTVKKSSC